ncbi:MAG: transporter substrate-binding domain-containing protein [Cryomorphaceae bacterium]|nr:transporter substrate-binding domain-containing protein [Cryomorphaceae bacterium]
MIKAVNCFYLLVSLVVWSACSNSASPPPQPTTATLPITIDLPEIKHRKNLILLTENGSTSYYLYRGQGMGYDYELVRAFAKSQGLGLQVKVLTDLEDMFHLLQSGDGDIIAGNLTHIPEREKYVQFTSPLSETRQVLVQRKPLNWRKMSKEQLDDSLVRSFEQLHQKEIYVHALTTFYSNILELEQAAGVDVDIIEASASLNSETLIRLVAEGQVPFTVSDENLARINATYYPDLDIEFAVSAPQKIAWAVRKDSDSLLLAIEEWMSKKEIQKKLKYTYKKYFNSPRDQMGRMSSEFCSLEGNCISEYDAYIKKYSVKINWDWKLLAAMIYEESRFNPEARSWVGAFGLMQLMPATGERFGIDTTQTVEHNIRAGVDYLRYLDRMWQDRINDSSERVKFILASYNIGPGHVLDAQAIARELNLNPEIWDHNVADCLLLKSDDRYLHLPDVKHGYCRGTETVSYVNRVMNQYLLYQNLKV